MSPSVSSLPTLGCGLVNGLFTGISISFPVAFVVLLFATEHALTAFAATFSIAEHCSAQRTTFTHFPCSRSL